MKVADISVGDRLENYRLGVIYVVTEIRPCGSCPCGWGEIDYDVMVGPNRARKESKTFKEFERLKYIRREGDRVP